MSEVCPLGILRAKPVQNVQAQINYDTNIEDNYAAYKVSNKFNCTQVIFKTLSFFSCYAFAWTLLVPLMHAHFIIVHKRLFSRPFLIMLTYERQFGDIVALDFALNVIPTMWHQYSCAFTTYKLLQLPSCFRKNCLNAII